MDLEFLRKYRNLLFGDPADTWESRHPGYRYFPEKKLLIKENPNASPVPTMLEGYDAKSTSRVIMSDDLKAQMKKRKGG